MSKVRRTIKIFFLSIGGLVGLSVLLIVGLIVYQSIDKEDSFFLSNAELQDAGFLRRLDPNRRDKVRRLEDAQFAVSAHRLKHGSGTIFAWRFYSNGEVFIIDDEGYRKITLWIAGPPPNSATTIFLGDESKAVLIYSDGGSAWPDNECCGYGTSGTVRITPTWRGFTVAIKGEITPAGTRSRECSIETLERTFKVKEITFESLTPWLGSAGRPGHPYDETYRRWWL